MKLAGWICLSGILLLTVVSAAKSQSCNAGGKLLQPRLAHHFSNALINYRVFIFCLFQAFLELASIRTPLLVMALSSLAIVREASFAASTTVISRRAQHRKGTVCAISQARAKECMYQDTALVQTLSCAALIRKSINFSSLLAHLLLKCSCPYLMESHDVSGDCQYLASGGCAVQLGSNLSSVRHIRPRSLSHRYDKEEIDIC
jgi:hypothetical protein